MTEKKFIDKLKKTAWRDIVKGGIRLPVTPLDGVSLEDAEEIYRYVVENAGLESIETICEECVADTSHLSYFFALTQDRLGETEAEHWLQNVVFRDIPIGNIMGSKSEGSDEPASDDDSDNETSELSGLFMGVWEEEVQNLLDTRKRYVQYQFDSEKVLDGFREALERVFLPPQPGRQDERVIFFIENPHYLLPHHEEALKEAGVVIDEPDAMNEADKTKGYRSIYDARQHKVKNEKGIKKKVKSDQKLRRYVREILSDYLDDDKNGKGLISCLKDIILDKSSDELFEFFSWHLTWATQRAQSQEAKDLSHKHNIINDDNFKSLSDGSAFLGDSLTSHQYSRQESMGRDLVLKSVESAKLLSEEIASKLRKINVADALQGRESITESQALKLLFPDVLELYFDACEDLVQSKTESKYFISAKELEKSNCYAQWKGGRDLITVSKDGQISIKASPKSIDAFMQKVVDKKRRIQQLSKINDTVEYIVEQTDFDEEFVETTLAQFDLFSKLPVSSRSSGVNHIDPIDYLESTHASSVKNDFKHRWTVILNTVFETVGDCRFYEKFPVQARRAFAALLPPHPYISKGTIPKKYTSWAWSSSRSTNMSYVRMYYSFIAKPIPYDVLEKEQQFFEGCKAKKEE